MRIQAICWTTVAAGLFFTPLVSHQAFAVSRAMQICTAKWNEHLRTLPAPPPPGSNAKEKFIKDCMAHTSNTPASSSTSHSVTGATRPSVTTDPPDPEKHDLVPAGH
jgi:hypothetical protein